MRLVIKQILFLCFLFCTTFLLAQENSNLPKFTVRGSVVESNTNNPIPNVNIEVNGGSYATTDLSGNFRIEGRKGDELTIKHKDFETVYYTIQSNERIKVEVQPSEEDIQYSKKKYSTSRNHTKHFSFVSFNWNTCNDFCSKCRRLFTC